MTQAGTARRLNEDSFQLQGRIYPDTLNSREQKIDQSDDYWQIFAVTDGMGGAGVGDIASRVVQSYIMDLRADFSLLDPYSFSFAAYIQDFLTKADQGLQVRLRKQAGQPVGCSLALIMLAGESCYTMSVGSCRIYLYREGHLYRMTEDHVLADGGLDRPLLFLGNHPGIYQLRAQNLKHMQVQAGDHFFLCTDGITDALEDEDIKWVLDKASPIQTYVESLFQNARRYDARDNQTILGLNIKSRRAFTGPDSSGLLYPDRQRPGESMVAAYGETAAKPKDTRQIHHVSQTTNIYSQPLNNRADRRTAGSTGIYRPDNDRLGLKQQVTGEYMPLNTLTGTNRQPTGIYYPPTSGLGSWDIAEQSAGLSQDSNIAPGKSGHSLIDLLRQNLGLTVATLILAVLIIILLIFL